LWIFESLNSRLCINHFNLGLWLIFLLIVQEMIEVSFLLILLLMQFVEDESNDTDEQQDENDEQTNPNSLPVAAWHDRLHWSKRIFAHRQLLISHIRSRILIKFTLIDSSINLHMSRLTVSVGKQHIECVEEHRPKNDLILIKIEGVFEDIEDTHAVLICSESSQRNSDVI